MTDEKIAEGKGKIDQMSQEEMARLTRFAPAGHPFFDRRLPFFEHFQERFKSLGGMTPRISKAIGW